MSYLMRMAKSIFNDQALDDDPANTISCAYSAPREQRTEILSSIANLAKRPRGHSCPECCGVDEPLCPRIAQERLTGRR